MRRNPDRFIRRALDMLLAQGHHVEAVATTGPRSAGSIARACIARGADLILVAGGDGTLNEVISGAVYSDVPIGLLPGGTANVLGTELGMGGRLEHAAKLVSDATQERISLGRLRASGEDPRYFALMAGAGLDAHIVYHVSASLKSALGKIAYWIAGFVHGLRMLPQFTVHAGGQKYRCSFALVSRVRNYGGDLWIAPNISLLDADFEVVLFSGSNPLRYMIYLLAVLFRRATNMKGVTIFRTDSVRLSGAEDQRIYVQVDGEYAGRLPAEIEIVPHCLTLLVPPGFSRPDLETDRTWTTLPTR